MRPPLLPMAALVWVLLPGSASAAALSGYAPARDHARIVFESGSAAPVLVVSAIEQEVDRRDVVFGASPVLIEPQRVEEPLLVVLESPEEMLRRRQQHTQSAGLLGSRTGAKLLDAVLLLCSPFVIPLILRRRRVEFEWPEEEPEVASPM